MQLQPRCHIWHLTVATHRHFCRQPSRRSLAAPGRSTTQVGWARELCRTACSPAVCQLHAFVSVNLVRSRLVPSTPSHSRGSTLLLQRTNRRHPVECARVSCCTAFCWSYMLCAICAFV